MQPVDFENSLCQKCFFARFEVHLAHQIADIPVPDTRDQIEILSILAPIESATLGGVRTLTPIRVFTPRGNRLVHAGDLVDILFSGAVGQEYYTGTSQDTWSWKGIRNGCRGQFRSIHRDEITRLAVRGYVG